mgnify:CR=1 FL=1
MDSAETAEDPEDAEAEEKLHFKTGSRRFPRRFKMLCSIWAARCSGVAAGGVTDSAAAKSISACQRADCPSLRDRPGLTASRASTAASSFDSWLALRAWTDAQ